MKVSFHTLGCKTNAYETQAILEQFEGAGFEIGLFTDVCDVYVINTCAVTSEAARKSRQISARCRRLNPDAVVVVTGCYAQEAGAALLREAMADIVAGNGEKSSIVRLVLEKMDSGKTPVLSLKEQTGLREYEDQHISGQEGHSRAYVKIQDGCDRFCSYCIIPFLRGRSRSRAQEDIISEVRNLALSGYCEIVLTGIDISSFTLKSGDDPQESLCRLIKLISEIPGVKRIRLGSLEEGIVSEKMAASLKEIKEFCPQFHMSLQSGSDSVLKRMNRHYTTADFAGAVDMIRRYFPNAAVTTDIITGFPGETEDEFLETCRFVEKIGFSRLHVFPFSAREGTKAARMPAQISKAVKEKRTRRLIGLGETLRRDYEKGFIGQECEILAEEIIASDNETVLQMYGYSREYVRIMAEKTSGADAGNSDILLRGKLIRVLPEKFKNGLLTGKFCGLA